MPAPASIQARLRREREQAYQDAVPQDRPALAPALPRPASSRRRGLLLGVVGTPVPPPPRQLAPLDPAWAQYNRQMLAVAEAAGDAEKIRFYRTNLRMETS